MGTSSTSATGRSAGPPPPKKLRNACDACHQTKVRCTGGPQCQACQDVDRECVYSVSNRMGRPRGTKNKKHLRAGSISGTAAGGAAAHLATEAPSPGVMTPLSDAPTTTTTSQWPLSGVVWPTDAAGQAFDPDAHSDAVDFLAGANPYGSSTPANSVDRFPTLADILVTMSAAPMGAALPATTTTTIGEAADLDLDLDTTLPWCNPLTTLLDAPSMQASPCVSAAAAPWPSPAQTEAATSPLHSSCSCLQAPSELLSTLKNLPVNPPPRLDVLLVHAHASLEAWTARLQCPRCACGDADGECESLVLHAMCLRTLVRLFQRCSPHDDAAVAAMPAVVAAAAAAAAAADASRCEDRPLADTRTRLGVYDVIGADRMVVARIVLARMLSRIHRMVDEMRSRLESSLHQPPPPQLHAPPPAGGDEADPEWSAWYASLMISDNAPEFEASECGRLAHPGVDAAEARARLGPEMAYVQNLVRSLGEEIQALRLSIRDQPLVRESLPKMWYA